jgi:hypothetical protein
MTSELLELASDSPLFDIPVECLSLIPSPNVHTSVKKFRLHVLQERKNLLVVPKAEDSFSRSPTSATYNPSCLCTNQIPPAAYLRSLKRHLASLSNKDRLLLCSLRNPENSKELLPLWVFTFWDEVSTLRDSQDKWKHGFSWLNSISPSHQTGEPVHTAFTRLETLGWASPLELYGLQGLSNLTLAQFLSDGKINDEAIDLMAGYLSSLKILPPGVHVATLALSNFISSITSKDALAQPSPRHIQALEKKLARVDWLYFPSFYASQSHWIAFRVNIPRRDVTYGTSYCVTLFES